MPDEVRGCAGVGVECGLAGAVGGTFISHHAFDIGVVT